jgi:hypothetical protein
MKLSSLFDFISFTFTPLKFIRTFIPFKEHGNERTKVLHETQHESQQHQQPT